MSYTSTPEFGGHEWTHYGFSYRYWPFTILILIGVLQGVPHLTVHIGLELNHINPYPRFFGTITERVFWKKYPESSLVTSQLEIRK